MLTCYTPTMLAAAGCCAPAYEPTQTDEVRNCLYKQLHGVRSKAVSDWNALEEFGDGQKAMRKAIDLHILQEYLMDQWNKLLVGATVQQVWDAGCFPALMKFFRCAYGIDITSAMAAVGVYNPSRPAPGSNVPTPE